MSDLPIGHAAGTLTVPEAVGCQPRELPKRIPTILVDHAWTGRSRLGAPSNHLILVIYSQVSYVLIWILTW